MIWVFVISSLFASAVTGQRHEFRYGEYPTKVKCEAALEAYKQTDHYRMYNTPDMDMRLVCREEHS